MRGISDDTMETIRFAPKVLGTIIGFAAMLAAGGALVLGLLWGGSLVFGAAADHFTDDCQTYSDLGDEYARGAVNAQRLGDYANAETFIGLVSDVARQSEAAGCPAG